MNRRIPIGITLTLILLTAAVTFAVTMTLTTQNFNSQITALTERRAQFEKLSELDTKVRENYVGAIDEDALGNSLARGYVAGIGDRYAAYFDAEQYKSMASELGGSGVGIGMKITTDAGGNIHVYSVIPGSPAEKAGVQAGDVIVSVQGQLVSAIGYTAAKNLLIGEAGTAAVFTVHRDGEERPFSVVRETFENVTVTASRMGDYAYIKIDEFVDNTADQLEAAVDAQLQMQAKGIVFDVRSNPGGTLDSVAAALDFLCPAGDIVSSTDHSGTKVLFTSDADQVDLPMMVLVNGSSASAAELFACDLRDFGKAKIVGSQTYGKGTMQSFIKLADGSGLSISVAQFNPYKSPNFEGTGLTPDFIVELSAEQAREALLLKPSEDPQLRRALEELGFPQGASISVESAP